MELYIHIPFCIRKCNYCDFLSFPCRDKLAGGDTSELETYVDALCREIASLAVNYSDRVLTSCFIGGGTPSVLPVKLMERVLRTVDLFRNRATEFEFTIECNPGTVDPQKLALYRRYGVNRISFGLQSVNDEELKRLGRIHSYSQFLKSYGMARDAGFTNINIDLMSAIPGQGLSEWERNLRTVAGLKPEHISAYSLIIEPGTPFWDLYGEGQDSPAGHDLATGTGREAATGTGREAATGTGRETAAGTGREAAAPKQDRNSEGRYSLPDEDTEREMYHMTAAILEEFGYERYEISNYAEPGRESKHNLGYWTGEEYVGAGLGAASYVRSESKPGCMLRYRNTDDMKEYLREFDTGDNVGKGVLSENTGLHPAGCEEELLNRDGLMAEYMILHLRLINGLETEDFKQKFGTEVTVRYKDIIEKYTSGGYLAIKDGRLMLTEKGLDVSNVIMAEFV